ncbi:alternate-type signal peptide domain-containing protein [Microbacterium sp. GXF7504]
MQKTTKAMVAVGAAIVLMLGGGGSLAYWQKTSESNTRFQTGFVSLQDMWNAWYLNGEKQGRPMHEAIIVPGDTVVYKQRIRVEAAGDNLYVAADVALGDMTATPWHEDHVLPDKSAAINAAFGPTYTITSTPDPDDAEAGGHDHPWATFFGTDVEDTYGVDLHGTTIGDFYITVTWQWPFDADTVDDPDTMEVQARLSTSITLRQVAEPLDEVN